MKFSLLHPTVQQYLALGLTIGEFGGATWLVIHDGHFFALYLAFTYLTRETAGGKHYHDVLVRLVGKVRELKDHEKTCPGVPMLHDCKHNPF